MLDIFSTSQEVDRFKISAARYVGVFVIEMCNALPGDAGHLVLHIYIQRGVYTKAIAPDEERVFRRVELVLHLLQSIQGKVRGRFDIKAF